MSLACVTVLIGLAGAAGGERPAVARSGTNPVPRTDRHGDPLPPGAIARLGGLRLQHGGGISNLLFTCDGKGLISAGSEPLIRLWDPATGKEVRLFAGHEAPVCSAALSPDGKTLASGGDDQTIRLWDVATGRELRHWSLPEDARPLVAFSASGRLLASGGKDNSIVLWDVDTGKEIRQLKRRERGRENPFVQAEPALLSLAFTPDGRHLLTAQADGLFLRDVFTGKCVRQYDSPFRDGWSMGMGGSRSVSASDLNKGLSFSADGQSFLMPSGLNGGLIVWELNSIEERARLAAQEGVILAARFSPDGKTLVSAAADGTLRVWDAGSFREVLKIATGTEVVADLAVAPDGRTAAIGCAGGRIHLWDLKTGKERAAGERLEPAAAIGFSPDGRNVVCLDGRAVHRWDARAGKELGKVHMTDEKDAIWCLSADTRLLAQARPGQPIRLLDATTGKEVRTLEGKHDQIVQLALAPDGQIVAAATVEGDPGQGVACTVRVWDAATGKELRQVATRPAPLSSLAVSPDSRAVGGGDASGGLHVWEVVTGKERCRLAVSSHPHRAADEWREMRMGVRMAMMMRMRANREDGEAERPCPLVFTPAGKEVALDEGEVIRVWALAGGEVVRRFACDSRSAGAFAFSPDGRLLAAAGPDNAVWLWDNASTQLLARLKGHRGLVRRLAFSSDGRALVSSSEDGTALVWDLHRALARPGPAPRVDPSEETLALWWADLADADAARAYRAIQKLAQAPKPAVRLLRRHLSPAPAVEPRQVARLIADLDDAQFRVREEAAGQLQRLHDRVAPALEKALAAKPSPEPRRRLEELLQIVRRRQLPADTVRALRAVEVLEAIGTPQAGQLLEELARGAPESRFTQEAKAALQRLAKQPGNHAGQEKDAALASPH
jgi:WD40 repeat protein